MDLGSKYLKTSVKIEISTFEIEYIQKFVKIRKLILFGPKCPNSNLWAPTFQNQITNLKLVHSK